MRFRPLMLLGALLLARLVPAVPARPGWLEGQAAGQDFSFQLFGDEFSAWAESRDGHTLLQDRGGVWRHARLTGEGGLEASELAYAPGVAGPAYSRGIRPTAQWLERHAGALRSRRDAAGRGVARDQRVEGQWNLLLIMIHYPDQAPVLPPDNFDSMMNQSGWHGTGSFNDYYTDLSYGRFSTVSTVTVWHEAVHEHDHYGYNQGWDVARELVVEAIAAADSAVDFSQYDNDGNGVVDGLMIVHSGHGAEEGNQSNIWSHRWGLWGMEEERDGVVLSDYTMMPELQGGAQSAIGVYVHEFGHALNLPDLYDTDYSSEGVGTWCVMSGGSWGGGGGGNAHVPVSLSAYCRQALGWATVTTTQTELVDYGLPARHLSDEIVRLELPESPGQYFLAENRPLAAWDRHQPAAGLYIWHVDENQGGNSEDDHYLVDLEQADGQRDLNQGMGADAGDLFPGATGNRLFNSTSTPSSLPYGGDASPVSISGIGDPADTLRATFFQFFSHQDLSWVGWELTDDGGGDLWPDPGETVSLNLQLRNRGTALDSLELELQLDAPGITVLEGSVRQGPVAHGETFSSDAFRLELAPGLATGSYPLAVLSRDGAGWEQLTSGRIQVGREAVLVYLDGAEEALGSWYAGALAGLGRGSELRARPAGATPPADMAIYDAVIWVCGSEPSPLSSADINAMDAYLAGEGRLLVSGQHLLQGVPNSGRAVLGADAGAAWNGQPLLRGLSAGGLLADEEMLLLAGANGAWNQELPTDCLQPRPGSVPLARWGTGSQAAILRREDAAWNGGRLILAGCSLESIHVAGGLLALDTVLERFGNWLEDGTTVGVAAQPEGRPAGLALEAWPNPFNPDTRLRLDLPTPGRVSLRVWNLAGQVVRAQDLGPLSAGRHELRLDLGGAASGVYLAEARTAGGLQARVRLLLAR